MERKEGNVAWMVVRRVESEARGLHKIKIVSEANGDDHVYDFGDGGGGAHARYAVRST